MARLRSLLCALGLTAFVTLGLACPAPATEITLVGSTLAEPQKAALTAALAAKPELSYGQIITQALADGMPCGEVVAFLCANAGKPPKDLENQKKIVYAAIDAGKCDPTSVITRALQAGAPLDSVIQAALRADVDRKVVADAAFGVGYTPEEIAMVFTNLLGTGGGTGGPSGIGGTGGWGGGTGGPPPKGPPFTPPGPPPFKPPPASPSTP
jgi:hypothetical protein